MHVLKRIKENKQPWVNSHKRKTLSTLRVFQENFPFSFEMLIVGQRLRNLLFLPPVDATNRSRVISSYSVFTFETSSRPTVTAFYHSYKNE